MAKSKGFFSRPWVWVVGIIIILIIVGVNYYNGFVSLDQNVQTSWSKVEAVYQERFDMVPNLVASVEASLDQEKEIFGAIAEARTRYSGAGSVDEKVSAANQMESALSRLLVIVENYPNLASMGIVSQFMSTYEGQENRIRVERNRYNDTVKVYNNGTKKIPAVLFARIMGFGEHAFFESAEGADQAPVVDFN